MSSRVNRYAGACAVCGARVPAQGGLLTRSASGAYAPVHLACAGGEVRVMEVRIGDRTFTRNARGRCEDAPCCGCCTI